MLIKKSGRQVSDDDAAAAAAEWVASMSFTRRLQ